MRVRIGEKRTCQMQRPEFKKLFNELEKIEIAEYLFGVDFPVEVDVTEDLTLNNPREVVDHFSMELKGWGPSPAAADFLKELAKKYDSPALARGLHASWRRDQISAVIREIFNMGNPSADGNDDALIPARKPRGPKAGGRAAAKDLDEDCSSHGS